VAARSSDGDVHDPRLGDAVLVSTAQRRRKSGDRVRGRVQVELVLRVDVLLGGSAGQRAALRRREPRRRHFVRVPSDRREQIRTQRTVAGVDSGRRTRHRRCVSVVAVQ